MCLRLFCAGPTAARDRHLWQIVIVLPTSTEVLIIFKTFFYYLNVKEWLFGGQVLQTVYTQPQCNNGEHLVWQQG